MNALRAKSVDSAKSAGIDDNHPTGHPNETQHLPCRSIASRHLSLPSAQYTASDGRGDGDDDALSPLSAGLSLWCRLRWRPRRSRSELDDLPRPLLRP